MEEIIEEEKVSSVRGVRVEIEEEGEISEESEGYDR